MNKKKKYTKQNRKSYLKRKSYKKQKKTRKNRKIGGTSNDDCSMCCQQTGDQKFIPNACLMKYGKYRAHKICSNCWWSKFAQEGTSHKCPGCVNNKPLNKDPYENQKNTVIDLTDD